MLNASGKPLRLEDVEVIPGPGAVPFNRKRFGSAISAAKPVKKAAVSNYKGK
jgi:hypothetical protein